MYRFFSRPSSHNYLPYAARGLQREAILQGIMQKIEEVARGMPVRGVRPAPQSVAKWSASRACTPSAFFPYQSIERSARPGHKQPT